MKIFSRSFNGLFLCAILLSACNLAPVNTVTAVPAATVAPVTATEPPTQTSAPTATLYPEVAPEMTTIQYTLSTADFPNPERGWFQTVNPAYETNTNGPILTEKLLQRYRDNNITLVRKYYSLYPYLDKEIGPFFLKELQADFNIARQVGVKIIPRFVYVWNLDINQSDASLERVLAHIDQLAPVLQANADVIDHLQAGFIGQWGEWHDSTSQLVNADLSPNDASRQIVEKLLQALPQDRMIALRYPNALMGLLPGPVDAAHAYDGSMAARLGFQNDGFLYDESDFGTFSGTGEAAEAQKLFLEQQARFTLASGEPAGSFEYSLGVDPRPQLARYRYVSLNMGQGDASGLYAAWKAGGIYQEIGQRLGYRFNLVTAEVPATLRPGASFAMTFDVQNTGFGGLYNPRPVEIVLRNQSTYAEYFITLPDDPRHWEPGTTTPIHVEAALPADIPLGDYAVFIHLPDPAETLYGRPEYSIRLANENTWEETSGYNNLQATLTVAADAPGLNPAGEAAFIQRTALPDPTSATQDHGPKEVNLGVYAKASASSVWEPGVEAEKTNDDDMDTRWSAGECLSNQEWYQFDWPMAVTFNKVVFFENPEFQRVRQYQLLIPEGDGWKVIFEGGRPKIGEEATFDVITTQILRVYFPEAISCPTFDEIQVFNAGSTDNPFVDYVPPKDVDVAGPVVITKRDDVVVDFQDRPAEATALTGSYQGLEFREAGWMTADENGAKYLYFDSNASEATLHFSIPTGQVLRGLSLRCVGCTSSRITIESEGNQAVVRQDAVPWWAILTVGAGNPTQGITLTVACDSPQGIAAIQFDNIVYGNPPVPDLVISFEDIVVEVGKPVELKGLVDGIDFGDGGWMLETDGTSNYIFMTGTETEKTLTLIMPEGWIIRGVSMQARDDSGSNVIEFTSESGDRQGWSWFPKGWWQSAYETSWDETARQLTITIRSDTSFGVSNILIDLFRLVAP